MQYIAVEQLSTVTRLQAGRRGSIPGKDNDFSLHQCPDRLWGPPSVIFNGYRGLLPRGKAAGTWSWPLTSI